MKKLFSVVTMLLLVLGLAGCVDTQEYETEITDLEAQLTALQQEKEDLETMNEGLEDDLADLEEQIAELQELLFDNIIAFSIVGKDGVQNATVGFDDDFDGTLFDLLNSEFDIEYSDTTFGKFIFNLGGLVPANGSFISFSKNGEYSTVGVESASFSNGDIFTFQITWYDETEEAVYNAIELFLTEQAETYVNSITIDANVLAGLTLLAETENFITQAEVEAYVNGLTEVTVQDYFKSIIMLESVGGDASLLYTALNGMDIVGGFGQTAYGLLALDANTNSEDYSVHVTNALLDFDTNTPFSLGLDAGGVSLVALSNYATETGVADLIDAYATWISDDQLDSGGILTREIVWGETTYPGTENAASIAQVIMGLIANDIDPNGADYTKTNGTLVSRLCEFQTATGSFDWDLTDDIDEDLAFSTPQAFLALAIYFTYSNTVDPVNPYNFSE